MLNFKRVNTILVLLFVGFLFVAFQFNISFWYVLVFVFSWILLTILGSFNVQWNYFLKGKHHNYAISKNYIALTFDDGPHPEFTPKVLELLRQFNVKATFFVIGKNAKKHPELVQKIVDEGHDLGNHSHVHTDYYGFLSRNEVTLDLMNCNKLLFDITEKKIKFFRPPFGVTNPNIARAVKNLNLHTFGWSIRSFDTVAKDAELVFKKINSKIQRGDVVLLHDSSEISIAILERLLKSMKVKNLKSVTLSVLFKIPPYEK